jgi:uncharacterized protein YndB with AHSA1/START domain
VRRTPAEAFEIFTARLASWWPLDRYSIHLTESVTCGIEPRVGGHVYEVSRQGERCVWGTVLAWDPPRGFSMTWHPGREPDTAQEVEVSFTAVPDGTRVDLEHRGWEKRGTAAEESREGYDRGWPLVLQELYALACA